MSSEKEPTDGPPSLPPPEPLSEVNPVRRAPLSPLRVILFLVGAALTLRWLPISFCAREAPRFYLGAPETVRSLIHGTGRDMLTLTEPQRFYGKVISPEERFGTGSSRFDGEWYFGTFMMSVVGTAHATQEHPELAVDSKDVLGLGVHTLLEPSTRGHDTKAWGEDALAGSKDHCAFLCYWLYAINTARVVEPRTEGAAEADRVLLRLEKSFLEHGVLETYPGEYYPVDMSMFMGALDLHSRLTQTDHTAALRKFDTQLRSKWLDSSGYLFQAVDASGAPRDRGRGSGTALASFALANALPETSRDLWLALRTKGYRSVLGFGAIREYATDAGHGDVDSGPVIFGLGISATGFALGAARIHGDAEAFRGLYASAHFAGAPIDGDTRRNYVTGGPIGQSILFAMLTARRAEAKRTLAAPSAAAAPVTPPPPAPAPSGDR